MTTKRDWMGTLQRALDESDNGMIAVRVAVEEAIGREPTRAELTAARRAAYTLADRRGYVVARVHVRDLPGGVLLTLATTRAWAKSGLSGKYPGERGPFPSSVRSIAAVLGVSKSTIARNAKEPDEDAADG